VSYEDLVGSHGGLGGWQGQPFLLHPVDLPVVDAPLIGAPAVHAQLRRWLDSLRTGQPADTTPPRASTHVSTRQTIDERPSPMPGEAVDAKFASEAPLG
jgi:hypothetical protein